MKTSSINATNFMNDLSSDKISKQGNSNQKSTNFSNVLSGLSTNDQGDLMNMPSQKKSSSVVSKSSTFKDKLKTGNENNTSADEIDDAHSTVKDTTNSKERLSSTDQDVIEETSKKIKKALLDVFNITEDDLESAMQMLGLEYVDCFDKNNLAKLLTQISGNSDISVLITDGTLYQQLNDAVSLMDGIKGDILSELGITEKELAIMIEQFKTNEMNQSNLDSLTIGDQAQNVQDQGSLGKAESEDATTQSATTEAVITKNPANETVKSNDTTQNQENSETSKNSAQSILGENGTGKITVSQNQEDSSNQMGNQSDQEDNVLEPIDVLDGDDNMDDNYQKFIPKHDIQENIEKNQEEAVLMNKSVSVNVEDIMKQIHNQIKITTNLDTTKMEFLLNPEHLGKLTIQLASKEGMITAHITAQNNAVKEILESQIVQLKENMNNQGLKVNAVEVTIESHEFEGNLENGNQSANHEQFEQQQKNSRRLFNYDNLESLDDLSAEEAVIAEMMIGNGNSINYTA